MPLLIPVLVFIFLIALFGIRIVNQYEKGIVLRLGKYSHTADAGLNFIFPYVDSMIKVDMRERVINVDPQKVITKDNVGVTVDAVIYCKVFDPVKAEFEVQDFDYAATTLAQTNLRNLIGDKLLDETLVARDAINNNLRDALDHATDPWGVNITRVEVQKIDPPPDITEAMSHQMKAEREKRAAILQSEGIQRSAILQAEGEKAAAILKAEGAAQARILSAQAEAESVRKVAEAANTTFDERAQKLKKLEVLEKVLLTNTKYIVPAGSDLVNVLGMDQEGGIVIPKKHSTPLNQKA
ncbi:MAG: SPFH domain-containing protein [Patescibacteria group bacterium]